MTTNAAAVPPYPTVGSIAKAAGVPTHKAAHILRSRGVEPVGSAGGAHIYSRDDAGRVIEALRLAERARALTRPDKGGAVATV